MKLLISYSKNLIAMAWEYCQYTELVRLVQYSTKIPRRPVTFLLWKEGHGSVMQNIFRLGETCDFNWQSMHLIPQNLNLKTPRHIQECWENISMSLYKACDTRKNIMAEPTREQHKTNRQAKITIVFQHEIN